jgi:adenosine kinase
MLIITGSLAYDYIMDFPGLFSDHILPEQLHTINLSFIVKNFAKRRGGTAGNVSYSLALLDTQHYLVSVAGRDFDEYKKFFTEMGINIDYTTVYQDTYTATGFAMTDRTNNQIWGYFYGATENSYKINLKKVATPKDLVLIGPQGAKGSMSLVKQCIDLNIPYMFDPGFILTQVSDEELAHGVEHATYLIGNDYEINLIQTRVKDFTQLSKKKTVITTLGEKGAKIETNSKKIDIRPANPKKVIDPTGAGDVWRSGFLAGIERGYDLKTCGQMGAVASSFALEQYGTQEHTFTKSQFTKRYKDEYNETLKL